jgi:phosphatidylinositol alpha-mannosyltransferase
MKIGLVSPYDYSFYGGVVNHISHLSSYFTKWGHDVKIIAPCLKDGTQYFNEEVESVGRPIPIPYFGSVARIPLSPWLPAQTRRILRREKFDIVHIHEPFVPMLSLTMLMQSNSINVGTFHAYPYRETSTYKTFKSVFKKLYPRLNGKIAVSKPVLDYLSRYIPGDFQIIPNGIEMEHFSTDGPRRPEFSDDKLNILFVGRLEKRKGLEYLIRACSIIKKEFSDFRLIVVGSGTRFRRKYRRMINDLNLDNIVFTSFVSKEELPEYYRTADIFCSPATGGESFGIVLLEAMACGKPVVASDIVGYASLLTHNEQGLLVEPANEEALAQALLTLLKDGSLRRKMGEKGLATAPRYSWSNVARQVLDYYSSLKV